jgi:hypothetical protein
MQDYSSRIFYGEFQSNHYWKNDGWGFSPLYTTRLQASAHCMFSGILTPTPRYLICRIQAVNDVGRLSHAIFDVSIIREVLTYVNSRDNMHTDTLRILQDHSKFEHKILDVAGESLTSQERSQAFIRATGHDIPSVPRFLITVIYMLNRNVRDLWAIFLLSIGHSMH